MIPDETVEATEEACQREPLLARTRLQVLRLEKDAHRAGWGGAPRLWKMDRDPRRDFVRAVPSVVNKVFPLAAQRCGGDVGETLQLLADVFEFGRGVMVDGGFPAQLVDLTGGERIGESFYGYALVHEAWAAPPHTPDDEAAARYERAGRTKRLHELPERVECRLVNLVCRDGLAWLALRVRRDPPVRVALIRPEGDFELPGLVPNGLSRMVRASVNNPTPVVPTAEQRMEEHRRGR